MEKNQNMESKITLVFTRMVDENGVPLCACGSGVHWAECPGDPELETPWRFCG